MPSLAELHAQLAELTLQSGDHVMSLVDAKKVDTPKGTSVRLQLATAAGAAASITLLLVSSDVSNAKMIVQNKILLLQIYQAATGQDNTGEQSLLKALAAIVNVPILVTLAVTPWKGSDGIVRDSYQVKAVAPVSESDTDTPTGLEALGGDE